MSNVLTIYLIRHAKTEYPTPGMDDFDRALTESGKQEAASVSAKLLARGVHIDLIMSSPAKRAKMTAAIFADGLKPAKGILFLPELYHPDPSVFTEVLSTLDSNIKSVAIVSHNNGITDFANSLGMVKIDAMPTSSVLAYEEVKPKKFLFFEKN